MLLVEGEAGCDVYWYKAVVVVMELDDRWVGILVLVVHSSQQVVMNETAERNPLALVAVEVGSVLVASQNVVRGCSYSDAVDQLVVVHAVVEVEVVHHLTVHAGALITGSLYTASSLVGIVVFEYLMVSLFLVLAWAGDSAVLAMHNLMCHSTSVDVMMRKACQMTLVEVVGVHSVG